MNNIFDQRISMINYTGHWFNFKLHEDILSLKLCQINFIIDILEMVYKLNFSNSTIKIIMSYLTSRTQFVQIDDKTLKSLVMNDQA